MRLIDADKLESGEVIIPTENGGYEYVEVFYKDDVNNAPTVDAEPVVRCKDCKWYEESKNSEIYPMRFCYRLKNDNGVRVGYNCDGNDFCSHGERREDERTVSYYGDNKLIWTIAIDERKDDGYNN